MAPKSELKPPPFKPEGGPVDHGTAVGSQYPPIEVCHCQPVLILDALRVTGRPLSFMPLDSGLA